MVLSGKTGSSSIEDTRYRFVADDVGMVGSIEEISALLIYHDISKTAKVLQQGP